MAQIEGLGVHTIYEPEKNDEERQSLLRDVNFSGSRGEHSNSFFLGDSSKGARSTEEAVDS